MRPYSFLSHLVTVAAPRTDTLHQPYLHPWQGQPCLQARLTCYAPSFKLNAARRAAKEPGNNEAELGRLIGEDLVYICITGWHEGRQSFLRVDVVPC